MVTDSPCKYMFFCDICIIQIKYKIHQQQSNKSRNSSNSIREIAAALKLVKLITIHIIDTSFLTPLSFHHTLSNTIRYYTEREKA